MSPVPPIRIVTLEGIRDVRNNVSAIAECRGGILVGADEAEFDPSTGVTGNAIQWLAPTSATTYVARSPGFWLPGELEFDLEGLAFDGTWVYAIGSHSRVRKKVPDEKARDYHKVRERLATFDTDEDDEARAGLKARSRLARFRFDDPAAIEEISLRKLLRHDPYLSPFEGLPGKENGVDLEGLACFGDRLVVGCRGPVFRKNWVPAIVVSFEEPKHYEVRFLNLDGRGIRDLARVSDGFLVLAGPVGDEDQTQEIWHWTGDDCLPGDGSPGGRCTRLCQITVPEDARHKAEGLALLQEFADGYEVIVVFDGGDDGAPKIYRIPNR